MPPDLFGISWGAVGEAVVFAVVVVCLLERAFALLPGGVRRKRKDTRRDSFAPSE